MLRLASVLLCLSVVGVRVLAAQPALLRDILDQTVDEKRASDNRLEKAKKRPDVIRSRVVWVDLGILENMRGEVAFDLFPGKRVVSLLRKGKNYSTLHDSHAQWSGALLGDSTGSVHVSVWNNRDVFIKIIAGSEVYTISPIGGRQVLVSQYDPERVPIGVDFSNPDSLEDGKIGEGMRDE